MTEFKFDIYQDQTQRILRIKVDGILDRGNFMSMVKRARTQGYEEQLNLLYDMRNLELPEDILLSDVMTFVRNHTSLNDDRAPNLRSASLLSEALLSDEIWEVYKYASNNAGLRWQFFTDENEALSWLQ